MVMHGDLVFVSGWRSVEVAAEQLRAAGAIVAEPTERMIKWVKA